MSDFAESAPDDERPPRFSLAARKKDDSLLLEEEGRGEEERTPRFSLPASRNKPSQQEIDEAINTGVGSEFLDRTPRKKSGPKKGPPMRQLHPFLPPEIAEQIIEVATQKGITQGLLIERAWRFYVQHQDGET